MGRRAVEAGARGTPFAFVIPPEQHDPCRPQARGTAAPRRRRDLHARIEPFRADGDAYQVGTDIILMSQPYRAYVKTLLERQDYPASPRGARRPTERPYDVAGWTLPAQMGVDVRTIERSFRAALMSRAHDGRRPCRPRCGASDDPATTSSTHAARPARSRRTGCWPPAARSLRWQPADRRQRLSVPGRIACRARLARGRARLDAIAAAGSARRRREGGRPPSAAPRERASARVAFYKPWVENTDEGWTRWLLEQYEFPFASVDSVMFRPAICARSSTPSFCRARRRIGS